MGNRMNFGEWGRSIAVCAVAIIAGCSVGPGARDSAAAGSGGAADEEASRVLSPSPLETSETSEAWQTIQAHLRAYSGETYPIKLAETGQWGQAYPGGIILLDRSAAEGDVSILAFKLAHEWGHHVLGHVNPHTAPKTEFRHDGAPVEAGTETEDAADRWAGQFLAQYNYDLEAVAEYLRAIPYDPKDTIHSPGPRRAELVARAAD